MRCLDHRRYTRLKSRGFIPHMFHAQGKITRFYPRGELLIPQYGGMPLKSDSETKDTWPVNLRFIT